MVACGPSKTSISPVCPSGMSVHFSVARSYIECHLRETASTHRRLEMPTYLFAFCRRVSSILLLRFRPTKGGAVSEGGCTLLNGCVRVQVELCGCFVSSSCSVCCGCCASHALSATLASGRRWKYYVIIMPKVSISFVIRGLR